MPDLHCWEFPVQNTHTILGSTQSSLENLLDDAMLSNTPHTPEVEDVLLMHQSSSLVNASKISRRFVDVGGGFHKVPSVLPKHRVTQSPYHQGVTVVDDLGNILWKLRFVKIYM